MEMLESMRRRRSVRKYTREEIPEEALRAVLEAGLLSPSGSARRPWEFIVVRERETLCALSGCREGAAKMLAGAAAAVVVVADPARSDVWTEDCAAAMANMHLMADSFGLGSCWIQGRLRSAPDGRTTEDYVRALVGFPAELRLEAILSLGMADERPAPHQPEELRTEKLHWEKY